MEPTKKPAKMPKSLKENEPAKEVEETPKMVEKEPTQKANGLNDLFAPSDIGAGMDDFVKQMKVPREKVDAPEISFGDDDDLDTLDLNGDDAKVLDNVEDGTLSHFDYDEDHAKTAEFGWIMLDELISFFASLYSGEDADKYKRFSEKKKPTDYQISVGAAMVKKYQAKMSLEYMMITLIFMAFAPTMNTARKDRKEANRKAVIEEEKRRAATMRNNFN